MEGACYGLRASLDAFARMEIQTDSIRLTGGGANSNTWRQIIADNFSTGVDVLDCDEGAALGAAVHACWTEQRDAGHKTSLHKVCEDMIQVDSTGHCEPDPGNAEMYSQQYLEYQRYVDMIARTKPESASSRA